MNNLANKAVDIVMNMIGKSNGFLVGEYPPKENLFLKKLNSLSERSEE